MADIKTAGNEEARQWTREETEEARKKEAAAQRTIDTERSHHEGPRTVQVLAFLDDNVRDRIPEFTAKAEAEGKSPVVPVVLLHDNVANAVQRGWTPAADNRIDQLPRANEKPGEYVAHRTTYVPVDYLNKMLDVGESFPGKRGTSEKSPETTMIRFTGKMNKGNYPAFDSIEAPLNSVKAFEPGGITPENYYAANTQITRVQRSEVQEARELISDSERSKQGYIKDMSALDKYLAENKGKETAEKPAAEKSADGPDF